jgi:hypothetical protein
MISGGEASEPVNGRTRGLGDTRVPVTEGCGLTDGLGDGVPELGVVLGDGDGDGDVGDVLGVGEP